MKKSNKLLTMALNFLETTFMGVKIAVLLGIVLLAIIIASICSAGELRTTLGTTTDIAPGCSSEEQITKLDIGYKTDFQYLSNEIYAPIFIQNSDVYAGIGDRLWYDINLSKNTCLAIGAGILYIYDGGDISGLADSWLYGSLGAELSYKSFFVGVDHVSSPFHHASDGDSGCNTVMLGFKWEF